MSNNITLFKSGPAALPDYLRAAAQDDITKMLSGGAGGKQISIRGGVWRMMVGGEEVAKNEDRALNFVVLAANPHNNRTYYLGAYEEGKTTDPACWSNDGVAPDAEVPAATRQFGTCAKCPQNIEGSGEGKSRACRFSRRLAVALENDISGNIYRIQLPAKSVFGKPDGDKMPLQAYAKFLAGHGVPITGVVTEARFDTSEAVPVLRFRAVRPLTRPEWEDAQAAAATEDTQRAIEFRIIPRTQKAEGESAAFQPAPQAAAIPEPVKRAAKPVQPQAKPVTAAAILDAWGSDDE